MTDGTKKSNGLATASLVIGIISIVLGFFSWPGIVVGLVAVILAIVAKGQIKADPNQSGSAGAATGGLITGILGMVIGIIMIVLAVMFVSAVTEGASEELLRELDNM